jgi:hypothetical protein
MITTKMCCIQIIGAYTRLDSKQITPVVTGLGEGARQKIIIHQVLNRSVKVWSWCEGLFHPHVPDYQVR